jgi:hypothetical protein
VDATHGWVVGEDDSVGAVKNLILVTTDGGVTWSNQTPPAGSESRLHAVAFSDTAHGWAVGDYHDVIATADGGAHWHLQLPCLDVLGAYGPALYAVGCTDSQHAWAVGEQGAIFSTTVGGFAFDTTPPVTTITGADNLWHHADVHLALAAVDELGGSGMDGGQATTAYKIDSGAWTTGTTVVVHAPRNHSNDGLHAVSYKSCDEAGNWESATSVTVRIDTTGPTTETKPASGHKGRAINLSYLVFDKMSPKATAVVVLIRDSHGRLVKRLSVGTTTSRVWHAVRWTPKARGTYYYCVTAKDLAGNAQIKAVKAKVSVR